MRPAIFLDRDGVIVENNPNYIRSKEELVFIPGSLQSLADMRDSPYKIIMVTNQSAVGRGIISAELAVQINDRVVDEIHRTGGRIDGSYMCPHSPQEACLCRKPKPGLLLQAAVEHSIDLQQSVMIGDALSDLLAAQAAGLHQLYLVRTGRGAAQEQLPKPVGLTLNVVDDLTGAWRSISGHP
jgi:D-glycero-D-manno-heptose 1,7-bisphosphate phosphatase